MRLAASTLTACATALALAVPQLASAQGISLAAKIGSTGIGGDVIVGLTDKLSIKGGLGFLPLSYDGDFDGNDYSVDLPPLFGTVALDVAVAGPLRVMGGLLYRSDDVTFATDVTGSIEINGVTYTESGTVNGIVTSSSISPYLGLGLGGVIGSGIGLYVDAGVAFTGDPGVEMSATGAITNAPNFNSNLQAEAREVEDDISQFRYWPVLNIGLKFGLGN